MPKSHTPYNKGKSSSGLLKARLSVSQKYKLAFVRDPKLREAIKRDYSFAEYCRKQGMFKPAIIFYGSIMEALLEDVLNSKDKFFKLIKTAESKKLVTPQIASRLEVIKYFRNYIHISAELKGDIEISSDEANFFSKVCDRLVNHLEGNKTIKRH